MKIHKLLEMHFKEIKAKSFNYDKSDVDAYVRQDKQSDADAIKMMGRKPPKVARPSGAYGYVKLKTHEVIKQPHVPQTESELDADGFHHFMQIIENHHSPCFPNVHDIIVKKDSKGYYLPQYTIERLIHIDDVPEKNLHVLFLRLTNGEAKTKSQLSRIIDAALATGDTSKIVDEELKRAVQILHKENNGKFVPDLHFNNIMFKFAGGAYQIVIIDPYAQLAKTSVKDE
jgi:hypothetical protein